MPESAPQVRVRWGQALPAGILLLFRITEVPLSVLFRDWLLILLATWLAHSLIVRESVRSATTVASMAYLLGIYVMSQGPHTLAALGFK